jgi:histidine triad (HIT) family protein
MSECIFCRIGEGEIPSQMVYHDEEIVAFRDIHPQAPTHILIIPRKHIVSLADIKSEDLPIITHIIEAANKIAREQGTGDGYRLVINTGGKAGQVVMHLHVHLLGGKRFPD